MNWDFAVWDDLDRISHNVNLLKKTAEGNTTDNNPMLLFADDVQTIVAAIQELKTAIEILVRTLIENVDEDGVY